MGMRHRGDLLATHRPFLIRRFTCMRGRPRKQVYSLALTPPEYATEPLVPALGSVEMAMLWAKRKKPVARAHFTKSGARAFCGKPFAAGAGIATARSRAPRAGWRNVLFRADIAAAARIFKAADRLRQKQLWQIEHHAWSQDREGDGGKEHHVNR